MVNGILQFEMINAKRVDLSHGRHTKITATKMTIRIVKSVSGNLFGLFMRKRNARDRFALNHILGKTDMNFERKEQRNAFLSYLQSIINVYQRKPPKPQFCPFLHLLNELLHEFPIFVLSCPQVLIAEKMHITIRYQEW